jgi:hypothetical protein
LVALFVIWATDHAINEQVKKAANETLKGNNLQSGLFTIGWKKAFL